MSEPTTCERCISRHATGQELVQIVASEQAAGKWKAVTPKQAFIVAMAARPCDCGCHRG